MAHAGFLAIARFFDSVVDAIRQFTIRGVGNTSRLVFTDARIANGWVLTHKQQERVFLGFCFSSTKWMQNLRIGSSEPFALCKSGDAL